MGPHVPRTLARREAGATRAKAANLGPRRRVWTVKPAERLVWHPVRLLLLTLPPSTKPIVPQTILPSQTVHGRAADASKVDDVAGVGAVSP